MTILATFKSLLQRKRRVPAQRASTSSYLECQDLDVCFRLLAYVSDETGCTVSHTEVYGNTLLYTVYGSCDSIEDFVYIMGIGGSGEL